MALFRIVGFLVAGGSLLAADPVYSGPQPGEKATPFRVLSIAGRNPAGERTLDPAASTNTVALIFVHAVERSLVPLLKSLDAYGASNANRLQTEIVFLHPDRISGEQRIRAAAGSLRLAADVGLSLDGAEGPGNYGLNKDCLMTVLASRAGKVATNFALVQPGITDAHRIIASLATLSGDPNPPTAQQILAAVEASRMDPRNATNRLGRPNRSQGTNSSSQPSPQRDPFPGAVPTDDRLQGLLRRFIRPTNDNATADAILSEVREYVGKDPELRRQAIDGWTRVLHFGDRYGTEHSRRIGAEFLKSLQSEPSP